MKIKSNYQDLIKLFALICMIIDHVGLYFFPEIISLRVIGRYAMPIFCFFAGYNFKYKPNIKILLSGLILHAVSVGIIFNQFVEINILISIFIGQIYIGLFQRHLQSFQAAYIHVVILACLWRVTHIYFDYGSLVIAIMILGFVAKNIPSRFKLVAAICSFLSLLHSLVVFYNFEPIHIILTLLMASSIYLTLTLPIMGKRITYNINFLTRHSLLIYCTQFILIDCYWKYFLIK